MVAAPGIPFHTQRPPLSEQRPPGTFIATSGRAGPAGKVRNSRILDLGAPCGRKRCSSASRPGPRAMFTPRQKRGAQGIPARGLLTQLRARSFSLPRTHTRMPLALPDSRRHGHQMCPPTHNILTHTLVVQLVLSVPGHNHPHLTLLHWLITTPIHSQGHSHSQTLQIMLPFGGLRPLPPHPFLEWRKKPAQVRT